MTFHHFKHQQLLGCSSSGSRSIPTMQSHQLQLCSSTSPILGDTTYQRFHYKGQNSRTNTNTSGATRDARPAPRNSTKAEGWSLAKLILIHYKNHSECKQSSYNYFPLSKFMETDIIYTIYSGDQPPVCIFYLPTIPIRKDLT